MNDELIIRHTEPNEWWIIDEAYGEDQGPFKSYLDADEALKVRIEDDDERAHDRAMDDGRDFSEPYEP